VCVLFDVYVYVSKWPTYPVSPVMMTTRCDVTASKKEERADEAGSEARTDNIYTHSKQRESTSKQGPEGEGG
jgi:hypothetical protein